MKRGTNLIAEYSYDNVGNRTKLTYGNGSNEDFDYDTDPRYRLEGIDYAYRCNSGSPITNQGGLDFTRDKSGNPLTWGSDKYTKSYGYDNNSRLTSANYPGHVTESWSYDWVGNRTISDYTYNAADQLTASPGKSYTYDNAGNLTAITGTGAKTFTYTPNNLVNTVTSGGNTSTMLWDNSGNRVRLTTSTSQVYNYLYDPTAGIPAVIEEVTPNGSIYYIREPNGALLARISGGLTEATTQYYHFDELGNTVFLTDSNAVVTDKYTYDAWGNVTSHTGSTSQPYQYVGQFGYYTHYNDNNLPYIQTGVRLYNTEVGRYMQVDVAKSGINWYVYVGAQPTYLIDPEGKWGWVPPSERSCRIYLKRPGGALGRALYEVCINAGDNNWSNCVRGCLQHFLKAAGGDSLHEICHAHKKCYTECDKYGKRPPAFALADLSGDVCHIGLHVDDACQTKPGYIPPGCIPGVDPMLCPFLPKM